MSDVETKFQTASRKIQAYDYFTQNEELLAYVPYLLTESANADPDQLKHVEGALENITGFVYARKNKEVKSDYLKHVQNAREELRAEGKEISENVLRYEAIIRERLLSPEVF